MALMMVHLLVADRWAGEHPEFLESPEYYLGAISPDAIHIRDHDDKSRKDEIHLGNWQAPCPECVIGYWHERSAPFDIGYGVHVLTDAQWVPRFKRKLPQIMRPDGRPDPETYYNDTFVTDFRLYRASGRLQHLMDLLKEAEPPSDHPLLTHYEFSEWQRAMVDAYHGECPRHGQARYFNEDYVRSFVDDSISMIEQVYGEAFS